MAGVELVQLDVRDENSVRDAVAAVLAQAGQIDVLINNAGVSFSAPIEATSIADAQAVFDTNLFGVLRVVQAVLPGMRAGKNGLIVNVSSVLGFLPAPFMGLYSAGMHALGGLSESLDQDMRILGIRVVLLQPTFTKTKLDKEAARSATTIEAYDDAFTRSTQAVGKEIDRAPEPVVVAKKIANILRQPHRLRQPADGRAKFLSILRRFAPVKQMDSGIRSTFGL